MLERRRLARLKVQEQVRELYELRYTALPVDAHLFATPLDVHLEKSIPVLKSWLRIVTKLSSQWGATALARAAQGCMPLEHYFGTDADIPDAALTCDSDTSLSTDTDTDTGEYEWDSEWDDEGQWDEEDDDDDDTTEGSSVGSSIG